MIWFLILKRCHYSLNFGLFLLVCLRNWTECRGGIQSHLTRLWSGITSPPAFSTQTEIKQTKFKTTQKGLLWLLISASQNPSGEAECRPRFSISFKNIIEALNNPLKLTVLSWVSQPRNNSGPSCCCGMTGRFEVGDNGNQRPSQHLSVLPRCRCETQPPPHPPLCTLMTDSQSECDTHTRTIYITVTFYQLSMKPIERRGFVFFSLVIKHRKTLHLRNALIFFCF